jgi:hypothetical protein
MSISPTPWKVEIGEDPYSREIVNCEECLIAEVSFNIADAHMIADAITVLTHPDFIGITTGFRISSQEGRRPFWTIHVKGERFEAEGHISNALAAAAKFIREKQA